MNNLRLIADVHISPLTVADLQAKGYDIVRTTDLLPPTASDAKILELARLENCIVVTQDLDFSMLIALGKYDQPSLITLRLSSAQPSLITQKLLDILHQLKYELLEEVALTINDKSIRIRKLPIS